MADDGLIHVPTMDELYREGLAEQVVRETRDKNGKVTKSIAYRHTEEGMQRITEAMRHNGLYLKEHPEVAKEVARKAVQAARQSVD